MNRSIFSLGERVVAVLIGSAFIGLLGGLVYLYQLSRAESDFNQTANSIYQTVLERVAGADAALTSLVGLSQSTESLSDVELAAFSESLRGSYPFLNKLMYMPRIESEDRVEFEAEMSEQGLFGFHVKAIDLESGKLGTSGERSEYLPIRFLEPLEPMSARLLGLDLYSSDTASSGIEQALLHGSSALVLPPQGLMPKSDFLILRPSYLGRFEPTTFEQRLVQMSGMFVVAVDLVKISETAMVSDETVSMGITIVTDESRSDSVFFHPGNNPVSEGVSRFIPSAHWTQDIPVGASRLRVDITQPALLGPGAFAIVLTVGLLALFLVVASVWMVSARRLRMIEHREAEAEIFRERERAAVTLDSIGDGVVTIDQQGNILFMNPVAERLTGWTVLRAAGRDIDQVLCLLDENTAAPISSEIYLRRQSESEDQNLLLRRADGRTVAIKNTMSELTGLDGETIGTVCVLHDISTERELSNALAYQARHDALTGLANRREFERRLHGAIEDAEKHSVEHVVCFMDLDQFKLVNDTCGHAAGDRLLTQLSNLLLLQIRKQDVLSRLGGDEFGLLLIDSSLEIAAATAERLREVVEDFRFIDGDQTFSVKVSIGVVLVDNRSGSVNETMSSADLACYAAKDAGRNTIHICTEEDVEVERRQGEMKWLPRLKQALIEDRFSLYMQPIVPLGEDDLPQVYEFLLRLIDEDGNEVLPGPFIPAAERYDLMRELDRWVIRNAFQTIRKQMTPDLPADAQRTLFTINLSGQSMSDPDVGRYISEQLRAAVINPSQVCFEITETAAISNIALAIELIEHVRAEGCFFALDDFGSGLSSFGYLKHLPVDYLKIDGQFVRDMVNDRVDRAMVWAIQDVGETLGIKTIAEFVEDQETLNMLKKMGVHYAQGFHLSRPIPSSEIDLSRHYPVSNARVSAQ